VKEIPLRNGGVVVVDDDDHAFLSKYTWSRLDDEDRSYAAFWGMMAGRRQRFLMHRLILGFGNFEVDHRDGNGLNNQRGNLRPASKNQNQHNRGPMKKGSSRFKGVWKLRNRWRAGITVNRVKFHIGVFDTQELAAAAFNEAALKHHREFSRLNPLP
jgi:hypothetical protein